MRLRNAIAKVKFECEMRLGNTKNTNVKMRNANAKPKVNVKSECDSNAHTLKCSKLKAQSSKLKCSNAQMLKRSNARMLKCPNAQTLKCSTICPNGPCSLKCSKSTHRNVSTPSETTMVRSEQVLHPSDKWCAKTTSTTATNQHQHVRCIAADVPVLGDLDGDAAWLHGGCVPQLQTQACDFGRRIGLCDGAVSRGKVSGKRKVQHSFLRLVRVGRSDVHRQQPDVSAGGVVATLRGACWDLDFGVVVAVLHGHIAFIHFSTMKWGTVSTQQKESAF